jgi:hypothetical protein
VRLGHLFICASFAAIGLGANAVAATSFHVVARPGQSAGAGNGVYSFLEEPVLNDLGRVAFEGFTEETGELFDFPSFIAIQGPEDAHIIAQVDRQAPDMPVGVNFSQLDFLFSLRQSNDNQIAFTGFVEGTGISTANDSALWAGDPNNLKLIAQENDVAPGAAGLRFRSFDTNLAFANGGFVALRAALENNKNGLWAGTDHNLQPIALEGTPAPGFSGTFAHFTGNGVEVSTNNQQRVAFQATVTSGSSTTEGIFTGSPGNIQRIAYEGMPIIGMGANTQIRVLWEDPQINDANEIAYKAWVGPPSGTTSDAILLHTAAGVLPIYQPGNTPPGFAAGTTFGSQIDFFLGNNRQIVFHNQVRMPDASLENALLAYENGNLRLVAREGQQIPGAVGDQHFLVFDQYYVNQQGRVAFMAGVYGDELSDGIWVEDANRELVEVVRTGMQIQLAPGDIRELDDIDWPDNPGGDFSPQLPYNSAGQIVFQATFSSDTYLLLYTPSLTGDYNKNDAVDAADYVLWRNSLNAMGTGLPADGNGDNKVDSADLQIWRANFGKSVPAASGGSFTVLAVPEPGTAITTILAILGGLLRPIRRAICRSFSADFPA